MIYYAYQDLLNNMKISLTIPGTGGTPMKIDSGLPVPTGGLFDCGPRICTAIDAIHVFINLILVISIFVALYFIGYGAVDMITSEGEKEKMKRGRQRVIYAGLGLIVIFLSFTAINLIGAFFGFNLLPFLFK